jgi:hypothetical protein
LAPDCNLPYVSSLDYYTVLTTEGESISQLIAGYIDIILKRKKDMGKVEIEDDSTLAVCLPASLCRSLYF